MTIAFTKVSLPGGWLGNMAAFPVEHDGKVLLIPSPSSNRASCGEI